jgi:O-antigen ligase
MSDSDSRLLSRLQVISHSGMLWSIVLLFFFVPISRAATAVLSLLICVLFFFSGHWLQKIQRIKTNPLTKPLLALCLVLILGYFYSQGSMKDKWDHFLSYARLLLVFVLIASLDSARWRTRCWQALAAACCLIVFASLASVWWQLPWDHNAARGLGANHAIFSNYLWQNVLLSFFACVCLFKAKHHSVLIRRLAWLLLALASTFSIFFLAPGRTGQLTALASIMLMVALLLKFRTRMIALLFTMLAFAIVLGASSVVKQRFDEAVHEVKEYVVHQRHNNSSVGLRLHNWRINSGLIRESPVIGYGSGSYRVVSERAFNDPVVCTATCTHPHNQFLYFLVENGAVAMLIFVWLLWRMSVAGFKAADHTFEKLWLPFALILFLHCLVDSPFVVSMDRAFYTAMMGLLAAGIGRYSVQAEQTPYPMISSRF